MVTGHKLPKNDDSSEVNQTLYRSMFLKLQYGVHRKPSIALAIEIVARFSANPKENHMMAVKMIQRYLKEIEDCGLWYKKSEIFELKVCIDVDQARNINDSKITSGGDLFLRRLISWTSKKQNCFSQSTVEAEYVSLVVNHSDIVCIKQLLKAMKEKINGHVIYCDNISAINISKNPIMHTKTKHIGIKYHYLRELVQNKEVRLEYVNTKEQIANIFQRHFLGMLLSI